MATYRGQDGIIKAVTTGGAVAEVAEVKSWTLDTAAAMLEDSAIGDSWRTNKPGLKSFTMSVEAHWDADDTAQADFVEGDTIDFELFPEGDTAGNNTFTGSAIVESVSVSTELESVVAVTFNCTGTGELTRGVAS